MTKKHYILPRLRGTDHPKDIPVQFSASMEQLETALNDSEEKRIDMVQKIENTERQINDMNKKLSEMDGQLSDFYIRLIEIFGIFVAIFSLIVITGNNIFQVQGNTFYEISGKMFGYLLPLALVLMLFILFLNWLVRKR
jgi:CII-binding regulator of phage lambda lysogenization HflD